jgi:hypothetical protein
MSRKLKPLDDEVVETLESLIGRLEWLSGQFDSERPWIKQAERTLVRYVAERALQRASGLPKQPPRRT